jgi:nucleotide-binding universal stress UspA family protein
VGAQYEGVVKEGGKPLHDALIDYAAEKNADFIVIAPRPQPTFTSVASHLICRARANVIVIKGGEC